MSKGANELLSRYSIINQNAVARIALWAKGGNVWAACPSMRCPLVGVADAHGRCPLPIL